MRLFAIALFIGAAVAGCGNVSNAMKSALSWHDKFGWKADDYFDDPKAIALCKAIQANDIKEIDRLVAAGANVKAKGKDNMTPLLWSFPDKKLQRFTRLLELGADPNVAIKSDLNTRGGFTAGDSVTHMACRTEFAGYFEAVFAHAGNPNFKRDWHIKGITPLFSVITRAGANKKAKLQFLIDKGADLNHAESSGVTPVIQAISRGGRYDLALLLLNAGANYKVYLPNSNTRLVHIVAMDEDRKLTWTPEQAADYQKLVDWLEKRGESIEAAKADIKRWQSWSATTGEYRRKMDAEIAERKAREARGKAADVKPAENKK